ALRGTFANIFDDRLNFFRFSHVYQVRHILTDHRTVGRYYHGIQLIDGAELKRFGICGTGHPRQLLVQTDVVLEGDVCQRLVFVWNIRAFFRCLGLVQAIAPATPLHGTAGVFIDVDDFAVFSDVVTVAGDQGVRAQCGRYAVHQDDVARGVQR